MHEVLMFVRILFVYIFAFQMVSIFIHSVSFEIKIHLILKQLCIHGYNNNNISEYLKSYYSLFYFNKFYSYSFTLC